MTEPTRFPFQLKDVVFMSLSAERGPSLPEVVGVNVAAVVRVSEENYPRLEIGMRMETQRETSQIYFHVDIVGVFELVEGTEPPERNRIPEFVSERAIFILWPYADQAIRHITTLLGVNPIKLPPPVQVTITPIDQAADHAIAT